MLHYQQRTLKCKEESLFLLVQLRLMLPSLDSDLKAFKALSKGSVRTFFPLILIVMAVDFAYFGCKAISKR